MSEEEEPVVHLPRLSTLKFEELISTCTMYNVFHNKTTGTSIYQYKFYSIFIASYFRFT